MFVYRYSEDEPVFNEVEENVDMLEDCDFEVDEYDPAKAEHNLKYHKFPFVPDKEGIGE